MEPISSLDARIDEILTPEEYLRRGTAVLLANELAVTAIPQTEIQYPHWNNRYMNKLRGHSIPKAGILCDGGLAAIFSDPQLQIDDTDNHWYAYSFLSQEVARRKNKAKYAYLGTGNVASIFASAKAGTIIMLNSCTAADIPTPGQDTPRLYNSELMYQAWRDTCSAYSSAENSTALALQKSLKFIIRAPIANHGTYSTIEGLLDKRDLSTEEWEAGPRVTYTVIDEHEVDNEDRNMDMDKDAFAMLCGTANGRPVVRMCADHAQSLGGKRVVRVHVWYDMPKNEAFAALVFELA
ncbi:hypothetical protein SBOR_8388 [Sclerotinia borealis F-4128]|uniref:Uncharacterized protein n=1 Tax=Sclerotinia borealis (strain F-4128) TaxID=1432307 RepID=W9C8M8_SCLBF|nr:hypothetical protein SBOR_8388 [Sclerotinia borealis F-4128]